MQRLKGRIDTRITTTTKSKAGKSAPRLLHEVRKHRVMFLMLAPTLMHVVLFSYLPMVGIYLAFTRFNFTQGFFRSPFVGLQNFEFLYKTKVLLTITKNTILYNLAFIFITNALQVMVAVLFSEMVGRWYKRIAQSIIFLPYFISFVLLGAFAYNFFNFEFGSVNTLLRTWGLGEIDVYNSPHLWKYILTFFYVWKNLGYGSVIYLAAIMNIDQEIYEAADIDGANVFQKVRHITTPHLRGTFIVLVLLALGKIMRGQFDLFYQLIGNNGLLYQATDIIDTYVYRTLMVNFDVGMSTAAGVYQSVFGLILILTVNFIIRRCNDEYALF